MILEIIRLWFTKEVDFHYIDFVVSTINNEDYKVRLSHNTKDYQLHKFNENNQDYDYLIVTGTDIMIKNTLDRIQKGIKKI